MPQLTECLEELKILSPLFLWKSETDDDQKQHVINLHSETRSECESYSTVTWYLKYSKVNFNTNIYLVFCIYWAEQDA